MATLQTTQPAAAAAQALSSPTRRAANDATLTGLQAVRWLQLNKGARRVLRAGEEHKTDELWEADARWISPKGPVDIQVYLRACAPSPVVAELICSVTGLALGLPIPEPFVVQVAPGVLQGCAVLNPAHPHLVFASLNVGGQSFAQMLDHRSDTAQRMIRKWSHLMEATAFDEWMLNNDRNMGNLIYAAQMLWMIDHAEALGGAQRALFGLPSLVNMSLGNQLASHAVLPMTVGECAQWLGSAHQWLQTQASTLDMGVAIACAELVHWCTSVELAELLDFLNQRRAVTHSLLCQRFSHPQLPLPTPKAA